MTTMQTRRVSPAMATAFVALTALTGCSHSASVPAPSAAKIAISRQAAADRIAANANISPNAKALILAHLRGGGADRQLPPH